MDGKEVQVLKLFYLVEDEPPLLWPTVWCYRDSFQATDLFVSHASKVKVIRASKHPTKRFRFFNHQGVLGLRISGEFRVKAKLIGRVWIRLNQSNSKGSLFLQQKPYHVWGHNLNSPIFIHFPYAFAEGFFYPKSGAHPSHPKKSEFFFWKFDRPQSLVKKRSRTFFCFSEFTILRWDYLMFELSFSHSISKLWDFKGHF